RLSARARLSQRFFRYEAARLQLDVACFERACMREQRPVACLLCFELLELRLQIARIQIEQALPLAHFLPIGDVDRDDLAVDTRPDRDALDRQHVSDRGDGQRDGPSFHARDGDGRGGRCCLFLCCTFAVAAACDADNEEPGDEQVRDDAPCTEHRICNRPHARRARWGFRPHCAGRVLTQLHCRNHLYWP